MRSPDVKDAPSENAGATAISIAAHRTADSARISMFLFFMFVASLIYGLVFPVSRRKIFPARGAA